MRPDNPANTPNAIDDTPAVIRAMPPAALCFDKCSAITSAKKTYAASVTAAINTHTALNDNACAKAAPLLTSGDMHCGKKAVKKIAVFGSSNATTKPSRKIGYSGANSGETSAAATDFASNA